MCSSFEHTLTCVIRIGQRERYLRGEGALVWGFVFVLLIIYIKEVLIGFLPLEGFPG